VQPANDAEATATFAKGELGRAGGLLLLAGSLRPLKIIEKIR
jgi:hypothetical protein